jgi:hypothetical protein
MLPPHAQASPAAARPSTRHNVTQRHTTSHNVTQRRHTMTTRAAVAQPRRASNVDRQILCDQRSRVEQGRRRPPCQQGVWRSGGYSLRVSPWACASASAAVAVSLSLSRTHALSLAKGSRVDQIQFDNNGTRQPQQWDAEFGDAADWRVNGQNRPAPATLAAPRPALQHPEWPW